MSTAKGQNGQRIVAFGEILWDMFPSGPRFGGAPANFAFHAASLGAPVSLVSRVGNDRLGESAAGVLRRAESLDAVVGVSDEFPTGAVQVKLDGEGSASYAFGDNEAWDHIEWSAGLTCLANNLSAVCFGTLSQRSDRSRETLFRFLNECSSAAMRVLDLNLRAPFFDDALIRESVARANVLKVNDDELRTLAELYSLSGSEEDIVPKLAEQQGLCAIAVTCGSRGGLIYRDRDLNRCVAQPVEIVDTVGAGDSFTAAFVVGLLRELPLEVINRSACRIAEFVCSQPGPTPTLPAALLRFNR